MATTILYGFHELADIFADRVVNVEAEVISTAIQRSVDEHNRQLNAVMGLFAAPTTAYSARFAQGGNHRLQPLDENGRARPIIPLGHYDTAYPIRDAGTAWGANYKTLAKMTVEEANRITAEMLKADASWMRDQLMAALFQSATYTYVDPQYGSLTVQPLALTSDGVTYPRNGAVAASTDDHHLATADAVATVTDPVPGIVSELDEHPENQGDVIVLIPTNLKADFMALGDFHAITDPNLTLGANTDTVNGTGPGVAVPGEVIGYHEAGAWLVEWKQLPSNYAIATTANAEPALRMREEPEAELQGFHLAGERNDHPFYEAQWLRSAGFGAYSRIGALVYRFGNGTYAAPTGYDAPIG